MWLRFPEGVTSINVQLQDYFPEAKDKDGRDCFRVPDHFAPLVLDLPGFGLGQPEGDLPDLPRIDSEQSQAIFRVSGQVDALKIEVENLRAALAETKTERDEFKLKWMNSEAEVSQLKEELGSDSESAPEQKGKK